MPLLPLSGYADAVLSSYWFVPSLMALVAAALAVVAVSVDQFAALHWVENTGWLYANEPEGARSLLATIAGSMITVAGVTFSITIATVAQTAAQYGPRLLTNFMQDRGNQITLGTFVATFLYCLLVLRTVRGGGGAESVFVPHLAIVGALLLALASLGVLIYFIHHIPESIHVSNLIAAVGQDLDRRIGRHYPTRIGHGPAAEPQGGGEPAYPEGFQGEAVAVPAHGNGYVLRIDGDRLMGIATERDLVLRLEYRPGDFVSRGKPLALAWPRRRLDDDATAGVRAAFRLGAQRTQAQDVMFLVDRLVEVAARALSPGMNDVFTAMSAIDWLGGALVNLAGREAPSPCRYDDEGRLRVVAHRIPFEAFADAIFGQLRPYVQADRNAALHAMGVIAKVAAEARGPDRAGPLLRHAAALKEGCDGALSHPEDRRAVDDAYRTAVRLLGGGEPGG